MNPAPVSHDEQYPYWQVNRTVLSLSTFLTSLGWNLAWPFLPLIVRNLGVDQGLEHWVGNMTLAFYAAGFLSNPLWGGLADHYGRKLMVLRATFGMGICMFILAFAWSPLSFAVMLVTLGLFNGNMPASNALLVANTPVKRLGGTLSLLQGAGLAARTVGPAAGTAIAALLTEIHKMFWLSGCLMTLGGILVLTFVKEVKQRTSGKWRPHWIGDLSDLLKVPSMLELLLLSAVGSMLLSGNVIVVSIFVVDLLANQADGRSAEAFWVGMVAVGFAVSSLVAMPLSSKMLDRRGPGRVLVLTMAAAAITQLPLLFLQTPMELLLARVAFGFTTTAMAPAVIWLLRQHAPKGMDARAISYSTSFQFIASGLAPFLAGLIGPVLGLRTYFAFTIVLTIGVLALWLRSERKAERPQSRD